MAKKVKSIKEVLSTAPLEIAQGIIVQKLNPQYFNLEKLRHQPDPIFRMDANGYRYYYRFDEKGEPLFYTSVTTMIKNTLPTSPYLINWKVEKGAERADEEMMERATYGTCLHALCGELLTTGKFQLDTIPKKLEEFCLAERITAKPGWVDDLKKDVLAFAQFMIEKNVKPLAIEVILYHPTDGYAGALDLVLEMDEEQKGFFGELYLSGANKGQPKESKRTVRINAILDIKSGRKGFYESHELQLQAYKDMWDIHFPDIKIDRLYNWSPKDYRGSVPSYNLKDQTDSKNMVKLPSLVALAKIEESKRSNMITVIKGEIDTTKGLEGIITELSFTDLIKKNRVA
jgi:hypothetical protein